MRLTFYGAVREVTGSCYLVETDKARVLVDCGMFQGGAFAENKNFAKFDFDPKTIDAVIVTHAHLDHTGRLPKLVKEGYAGPIYMTPPTVPLTKLVLEDAHQIMEEDHERYGTPTLFDEQDIQNAVRQFTPLDYTHAVTVGNLTFRYRDAGHIFGSAFVEMRESGGAHLTFSGDVGNVNAPILRDTAQLANTDALVLESTYGNRVHEDESKREIKLQQAIIDTIRQKGVLLIPAFAIERTQLLIYEINKLIESHAIPKVDVYLDSPMAIKASDVIKSFPQYYDREALSMIARGDDLFDFPGLHRCMTKEQSKAINDAPKPKIIIAGAGMMNGGRILHHLIRYLGDAASTVLIIAYQAHGTLGHRLYRGDRSVEIMGEKIFVQARIISIGAYSAHADQNVLLNWVRQAARPPKKIFCTHGDEGASAALATRLTHELGIDSFVPRYGNTVEL